ncbi:MAG: zinc-dependent alcohol dehydrogenase family protein [Coriobacteriia bacterium]
MKALVYHGPGNKSWEEVPKPTIQKPTDAIVRVTKTTICGTDLHIMKGDVAAVTNGRILGHEAIGVVEEVGSAISNFQVGDKVLMSCITSCGKCGPCKGGMYSHCDDGGWILGHLIDGVQAEYVRIPHADNSMYAMPEGLDENALVMVADIVPTGFEIGVLNGQVEPGKVVAIVGAGPVGLAALMTAQFYSPAEVIMVDVDPNRLEVAKKLGATHTVNNEKGDAVEQIMALTGGRGVDVAIEAIGIPATFDVCQDIVAAGGNVANVGVHGKSVELKLEKLWIQNITLTTGLVDTRTIPKLLEIYKSGKLDPSALITHHFKLDEMIEAYEVFGNAAREKALKVILTAE